MFGGAWRSPGSVLAWGASGRWFESSRPDFSLKFESAFLDRGSFMSFLGFVVQKIPTVC